MPNSVQLKARGLYTFPNHLSEVPDGALTEALNVIIDRNSVIEPRRGFAQFGNSLGISTDRAKQILTYKNRVLFHYDNKLSFDSDGAGTFLDFSGTFAEAETGLRIKSIEQNGNLYFTTASGIKKISALNASQLTTASGFISDAGGIKALDGEATINYTTTGFFSPISKVAYRIVWNIVDNNDIQVTGSPSSRIVVENISLTDSGTVDLTFPVPSTIVASANTDYFYQIYRTGVFSAASIAALDFTGAGDEMNLVLEDFYDGVATSITVSDITPEDFRQNGPLLYTNQVSGGGIEQANEPPPFAKDLTEFKGHLFYSNTSTIQRLIVSQLSADDLISGTSTLTVTDGTSPRTYTYRGATETYTVDFSSYAGTVASLNGKYILLVTGRPKKIYKVWFNDTGNPGSGEPTVAGTTSIEIDTLGDTDVIDVATSTKAGIDLATIDFNITDDLAATLTVVNANNGRVDDDANYLSETIGGAFSFTGDTLGDGEDTSPSVREIFLPRIPAAGENGPTLSQQIDQSARSLVRVLNADTSGLVNAFYISGSNDIPGTFLLEQRILTGPAISITANSTLTGNEFNPAIPTSGTTVISSNEVRPNRIYYSKFQEPEAVPLVNFIDVGPKDEEIQRIIALRDSLFIFKEDGIYRLTGETAPFQVALFDSSAVLQAPDSAVVLNNLVHALSTQGVISVSDTGVNVISRPIEDKFLSITRDGFSYKTASFGVAYETDRAYTLWTVTTVNDTTATQCFRYNSFTNTWTRWDVKATCGIINSATDKMYIGAGDVNTIEQERKTRTRTDYADREYATTILADEVNGTSVEIASVTNAVVGDVLYQEQYLTIAKFNQILSKLDNDPSLPTDYVSTQVAVAGNNLSSKMTSLVSKLNTDDTSHITKTFVSGDVTTGTDLITKTAHGYINNNIVYFSNSTPANLPGGLTQNTKYYIITATTNTFQVSTSLGGSPVDITSGGTGTHTITSNYNFSGTTDFATIQQEFNDVAEKLDQSTGVFLTNYPTSSGTTDQEGIIKSIDTVNNVVVLGSTNPFIFGNATIFNAIETKTTWDNDFFQDPSLSKHVRSGTFLFEDNNFSSATVSYSSDLSPSFDEISFNASGVGDWGEFGWGEQNWGGISSAKPLRTLIPPQKQRCRWITPRFEHKTAREKYSLLGLSLTYRITGERAYK